MWQGHGRTQNDQEIFMQSPCRHQAAQHRDDLFQLVVLIVYAECFASLRAAERRRGEFGFIMAKAVLQVSCGANSAIPAMLCESIRNKRRDSMTDQSNPLLAVAGKGAGKSGGILGSLKEALAAASREDTIEKAAAKAVTPPPVPMAALPSPDVAARENHLAVKKETPTMLTAKEAARESRGQSVRADDATLAAPSEPPTTRVVRGKENAQEAPPRTQLVRGKVSVKRGDFSVDPVVGWLVVVGGPGIGQFRAVFEGNNTLGRSSANRIAVDFGDEAISSEEQAYIRYDSADRSFLFVPNLAKTNVVSVNERRPTGAVTLAPMDVITMGRTQLVFVPFCGPEFDWSALGEK
jgi:hypothetical protein